MKFKPSSNKKREYVTRARNALEEQKEEQKERL
jgi:hypothetical protein